MRIKCDPKYCAIVYVNEDGLATVVELREDTKWDQGEIFETFEDVEDGDPIEGLYFVKEVVDQSGKVALRLQEMITFWEDDDNG